MVYWTFKAKSSRLFSAPKDISEKLTNSTIDNSTWLLRCCNNPSCRMSFDITQLFKQINGILVKVLNVNIGNDPYWGQFGCQCIDAGFCTSTTSPFFFSFQKSQSTIPEILISLVHYWNEKLWTAPMHPEF